MKAIVIRRGADSPVTEFPEIINVPDSAVSRDNRPVFLPDGGCPWQGHILPAYRICRLGKNVPPRFAVRYFDAVTLAVLATPAPGTIPQSLAAMADGALTQGKWIDLPEDIRGTHAVHKGLCRDMNLEFSDASSSVCEAIHAMSRCMTLKMGDIIIPFDRGITLPLHIDSEIAATLDGIKVLEYRIK